MPLHLLLFNPKAKVCLVRKKKTQLVEINLKDLVSGFIACEWIIRLSYYLEGGHCCVVFLTGCVWMCACGNSL